MTYMEFWELLSYIVTVFGLPLAIIIFIVEQRKERENEEEEIFQRLSDEYREFLKLVLENSDLQLLRRAPTIDIVLTPEQSERRFAIYGILISLFERAYLLVYEENMDKKAEKLWNPWKDYMIEWAKKDDFRASLNELLDGEDPEFSQYILNLVKEKIK